MLSLPGPTHVPEQVLAAMARQPVDIYAGELLEMTKTIKADLATLMETAGDVQIYAANGHGAWEAALVNTLSPGDRVLVLECGRFAVDWGEMAGDLGLEVVRLPGSWRRAVDHDRMRDALAGDPSIRAVLCTQIDTASGVANDIPALRAVLSDLGHDALFMVDVIGSLGCVPFSMDAWGVDVAVAGVQKGLMCPPGLSFTAAGPRALDAHAGATLPRHYWDWNLRNRPLHYFKYCGTPPMHMLFALRAALDMIAAEGMARVIARHAALARAVQAAADRWVTGGTALSWCAETPEHRAGSVTTLLTGDGSDPDALYALCDAEFGLTLGKGIGDLRGQAFRIAHMGHVNAPMILGALATVELAMGRLGWDIGTGGAEAAIKAMT